MFGFSNNEEYEKFRQESARIFGEGPYSQAGKHTDNVILVLPGDEETYRRAREATDLSVFDPDAEHHKLLEAKRLSEVLMAVGQPPEEVSVEAGTGSVGKGAQGLPQQFLEFLMYSGGVYGGIRAFYDIGKFVITTMVYLYEKHATPPLLNKGGVTAVCAVDLVDNRGVEEYQFVSAMEAQEGHNWDPSIDQRDVYYVTFVDQQGEGHLYAANARGAILHYSRLPITESWQVGPSFLEKDDDEVTASEPE